MYIWGCGFIFAIINFPITLSLSFLFLGCFFRYIAISRLIPMVWFIFFMLYIWHFSLLHISSLPNHFILLFSWWGRISSQKILGWPSRTKIEVGHGVEVRAWVWLHVTQNKRFNYICFYLRPLTRLCPLGLGWNVGAGTRCGSGKALNT